MRSVRSIRSTISFKIGIIFLILGILLSVFSVISGSQVLAFIGLGLLFWGVLFLLTRPASYVEGNLLSSTAISEYLMIDRITRDFKLRGRGYYIPPYPKSAPHLPEHLRGLKDMVVFLTAEIENGPPSIEEMAEGKFLLETSKGVLITPPGLGFLTQIEKHLRQDLAEMKLEEICEVLPRLFTQDFNLANTMEMARLENEVSLKIFDSLYQSLYHVEMSLSSIHLLGCPIVSAVACALAKSSGKIVAIEKQGSSPDGLTIDVRYRFLQG